MERLIYVSTAIPSLAGGDVFDIIQKSSLRNPDRGITGFLCVVGGLFFQYIEGDTSALDKLLGDLAHDPRHHSITILGRWAADKRAFPAWKMKRIHLSQPITQSADFIAQLRTLGIPEDAVRKVEQYLAVRQD
ncbi:BLUF domain-containing protein [Erythrobacter sp.]|uniref:BLUF domain-containing protein n=1 Tax=Erythrobacter sp. TaxID=1042 RepID=UPI0025F20465|nr:BLUF domain-containing protein [Erythrobacter sp.]